MGHALVLNATYEPLGVVSDRRALLLVLCDKAIAVEESDRSCCTAPPCGAGLPPSSG